MGADGVVLSRVCGMLAVSRSLGDNMLRPYLSALPDVHGAFAVHEQAALVLACDGVWDVLSDEMVATCVRKAFNAAEAATRIRDLAYARNSTDNISVIVVDMRAALPPPRDLRFKFTFKRESETSVEI